MSEAAKSERVLLTGQLKSAVHAVIDEASRSAEATGLSDSVLRVLHLLERFFEHGLKHSRLFGDSTAWLVWRELPSCLPGTDDFVRQLRNAARG